MTQYGTKERERMNRHTVCERGWSSLNYTLISRFVGDCSVVLLASTADLHTHHTKII